MNPMCLLIVVVIAASASAGDVCSEPAELFWTWKDQDISFSTSIDAVNLIGAQWNQYNLGGVASMVGLQPDISGCSAPLSPVFSTYNYNTKSHFFTSSQDEMKSATTTYGYTYNGVGWYQPTVSGQCSGTKPVYRYYIGQNYFYTFDKSQGDYWVTNYAARDDGIVGYNWPPPGGYDHSHPTIDEWGDIFKTHNHTYTYVYTYKFDNSGESG